MLLNFKKYRTGIVIYFIFLTPVFARNSLLSRYTDLVKDMKQDFVLETRRIQVPGYEYIFNPAIVRWQKSLLMSFRIHDSRIYSSKKIGIVWLDEQFNVISDVFILNIPLDESINFFINKNSKIKFQDPRLITMNDRLYIIYSHYQVGRVFMAELLFDGEQFIVDRPESFVHFPGEDPTRMEKNWVPFFYNDTLLFAYSIAPHKIMYFIKGTQSCGVFSCSYNKIKWKWGDLRGGTPAVLIGDYYLSFFHSTIKMQSVQSEGKKISHYFMGAYTFSAKPPFHITHCSPYPVVADSFYYGQEYKTVKPLLCVFPMGIICDDNYVWVSYGKQDHESWIVKFDKKKLLQSLQPVTKLRSFRLAC